MGLAATCVLGQGLLPNVQPELQRGRIMPQIRRFTGVNSVTNIEPDTGFMPALLFKFADWLETFSRATRPMLEPHVRNQKAGLGCPSYSNADLRLSF